MWNCAFELTCFFLILVIITIEEDNLLSIIYYHADFCDEPVEITRYTYLLESGAHYDE